MTTDKCWLRANHLLLGASLAEDGTLDEQSATALRAEIQEMVDETAERAKQAPFPTLEEIRNYVYAA